MNFEGTIRDAATKAWRRYELHREWLAGEASRFPWRINIPTPSGKRLVDQFETLQIEVAKLKSGQQQNPVFEVEYIEIVNRSLGKQRVPNAVVFSSLNGLLIYLRKQQEWKRFTAIAVAILEQFPALKDYLSCYPGKILQYENRWENILNVCRYRSDNPTENIYLRQLSLPNVDTKFIESHKALLKDLFDRLLPSKNIHTQYIGIRNHGFEQRFGFLFDPPRIRIRILDDLIAERMGGITDFEVPLAQIKQLDLPVTKVFITENKMNGLTFPPSKSAIVLFGLGYGIQVLKEIPWVKDKKLYYWGDIDTHGLIILSRLRAEFPKTTSFLMNETILLSHQNSWVTEKTPIHEKRLFLDASEQRLYRNLLEDAYGMSIRLEQERIQYSDVVSTVLEI